jgi:phosphatidylserine decarboxylase
VVGLLWGAAGLLAALGCVQLYLRRVWFYRDPERRAPGDPDLLIAACDGTVVYVRPVEEGAVYAEKLGERIPIEELTKAPPPWPDARPRWVLGVYMSPLDVHFNYAPGAGVVRRVVRTAARANLPMVDLWEYVRLTYLRRAVDLFAKRHHLQNERNTIFAEGPAGRWAIVEIADKFVNKIDCFVQSGSTVAQGQKVGFISRGSQVDLVVYDGDAEFLVRVGDRVRGGVTPVVRLRAGRAGA